MSQDNISVGFAFCREEVVNCWAACHQVAEVALSLALTDLLTPIQSMPQERFRLREEPKLKSGVRPGYRVVDPLGERSAGDPHSIRPSHGREFKLDSERH